MNKMPSELVDLTVTSPPYDNLRNYTGYIFDFESIARELYRVTKEGGVVVWVIGDATIKGDETGTSFRHALFFKEIGFNLHDTMIYQKAQACFGSNKCYFQSFEYMFVFSKGVPRSINLIYDRENKRTGIQSISESGSNADGQRGEKVFIRLKKYGRRKNIWEFGVGGGVTGHPAVMPEKLARDHIISWSNVGDIVFDPMCGSGTTCVAAKKLRRKYIGVDTSKKYCEMTRERLK